MVGCCSCTCGLVALGAVVALAFIVRFVNFARLSFFASPDLKRKYAKAGTWAVVTGASEGIGQALALDFAKRGFNVCVIARSKEKLESTVADIQKKKVDGKSISFDFSTATAHDYKKLFNELDALELAVLVNNVGINYTFANYFDEVDIEEDLRILKVNCEAQLQMTKYAVRRLKPKRSGAIVSLSSFTATTPAPLLSTYAATKSFNYGFSNSLAYELEGSGVDVLTVTPNLVISRMTSGVSTKAPKPSFLKVAASPMARQTLNALGTAKVTSGHRNHAIIEFVLSLLPTSFVAGNILKMHQDIKKRAERKLQQDTDRLETVEVGKNMEPRRHRTIDAPPAAAPYRYLATAAAAATAAADPPLDPAVCASSHTTAGGREGDNAAPNVPSLHSSTAGTNTENTDAVELQAQLMHTLYERRLMEDQEEQRVKELLALERKAVLLEKAQRINEAVAQAIDAAEDDADADDAALERQLFELESRLSQRSERLQWGAVADEGHPSFDSRQLYHETVAAVLEEKTRKAARRLHQEAAQRDAANKAAERQDMSVFCREIIVKGAIVDEGLLVYELVREAQRDAEMLSAIMSDGDRREAARVASEAAAIAAREAREANYLHCADPVLRQLREDAAARRAEEYNLAVAQEEAELAALEHKLEKLSIGFVVPVPSSTSSRVAHRGTPVGHANNGRATRGSVPYWKRTTPPPTPPTPQAPPTATASVKAAPQHTTAVEEKATMTVHEYTCDAPVAAPTRTVVRPAAPLDRQYATTEELVPAAEVATLLHIIDLAADDGEGRTGRGLALLLSGIDV